jgi:DNA-directed RNA polymerase subunit RPC12/RpoP
MGYTCKICGKNTEQPIIFEATAKSGILTISYVCKECKDKLTDADIIKLVYRKILH